MTWILVFTLWLSSAAGGGATHPQAAATAPNTQATPPACVKPKDQAPPGGGPDPVPTPGGALPPSVPPLCA